MPVFKNTKELNEKIREMMEIDIDYEKEILKNGLICTLESVEIYKPGESILNDQRPI